jgi:hypothetical protein
MVYKDGARIDVGDQVLFEHGQTPGEAEHVIESDEDMKYHGVEDSGVMLLSPPFGRVYWDEHAMDHDPLVLVRRKLP